MQVTAITAVTDSVLTASNIPEPDSAVGEQIWNSATTYTVGQRVIRTSTHKVYEATTLSGNLNKPPESNPTFWLTVGATNRWKPFDGKLSDIATRATTITYTLTVPAFTNTVAMFGLTAASVQVVVKDATAAILYNVTKSLTYTADIVDWFEYFNWDGQTDTVAVFTNLPAYKNYTIEITAAGTNVQVGEITFGRSKDIGSIISGTELGIIDYSTKERDTFGNPIIVPRVAADLVRYQFVMPSTEGERVRSILRSVRSEPAVYYAEGTAQTYGTVCYGFYKDLNIPLSSNGVSFVTLEVEGLT